MIITKSTSIKEALAIGKECSKCGNCCSYSSGALFDADIPRIAEFLKITKKALKEEYLEEVEKFNTLRLRPKLIRQKDRPHGRCVFLEDNNHCRIHEVKPTECRIGNCGQDGEKLSIWFRLNYYVNPYDPESIRQWAMYLETNQTISGGNLTDLVPDKERLSKMLNYSELRKK